MADMDWAEEQFQRARAKRDAEQQAMNWSMHKSEVLKSDAPELWVTLHKRLEEKVKALKATFGADDLEAYSEYRRDGAEPQVTAIIVRTIVQPLIQLKVGYHQTRRTVHGSAFWQTGRKDNNCRIGPFRMEVNPRIGVTFEDGPVETVAQMILQPVVDFLSARL